MADPEVEWKKAEAEYRASLQWIEYQIRLLWLQYGAFLTAESVLLGFIAHSLTKGPYSDLPWLPSVIAFVGLVIALFWRSTFEHNYAFYTLRMEQARRHESRLGFRMLTEGKELSDKRSVEIPLLETVGSGDAGKSQTASFRLPKLAASVPPRIAFPWLVNLFAVLFLALFLLTLFR